MGGKASSKEKKPAWEARDEPGCIGKGMERENTQNLQKPLSLQHPYISLKKQVWRDGERWQEGPFTPLQAMASDLWNSVGWKTRQ